MSQTRHIPEPLGDYLSTFCNVNALSIATLKNFLAKPENEGKARAFREQLDEAIGGWSLSKDDYEFLTHQDFDTQEELVEWLKNLRSRLFGEAK